MGTKEGGKSLSSFRCPGNIGTAAKNSFMSKEECGQKKQLRWIDDGGKTTVLCQIQVRYKPETYRLRFGILVVRLFLGKEAVFFPYIFFQLSRHFFVFLEELLDVLPSLAEAFSFVGKPCPRLL